MRRMMIALAAVLVAAPLSAQSGEPAAAAGAWRRMPVPDARLRVERAPAGDRDEAEWAARSSVQWMFIGAAVGCVGGSAGVFLGGLYGLLTGG